MGELLDNRRDKETGKRVSRPSERRNRRLYAPKPQQHQTSHKLRTRQPDPALSQPAAKSPHSTLWKKAVALFGSVALVLFGVFAAYFLAPSQEIRGQHAMEDELARHDATSDPVRIENAVETQVRLESVTGVFSQQRHFSAGLMRPVQLPTYTHLTKE